MFVRFRKRSLNIWADETLEATLVSNRRINGKVRQDLCKYLGSIRLSRVDSSFRKTEFWRKVRKSLATLDLDPILQKSIEEKILERVPMPDEMMEQGKNRTPPDRVREGAMLLSQSLKRRK